MDTTMSSNLICFSGGNNELAINGISYSVKDGRSKTLPILAFGK